MSVLRSKFMLRSMLILSRSCCIDLHTARCLRAYWTMFNDRFAPEAVAGRVCSSQYRGALLRNRIVGLAFTQRLQRVEYNRDVDRLLKQSALNGHDIAERCGDHAEQ